LCVERPGTPTRRKNYSKPQCVSKSVPGIAHLLHEKLAAHPSSVKRAMSTSERIAPILLVQDYRGDSRSIQDAVRSENLHGHSCDAASGSDLVRLLSQQLEWTSAERPDFLVLDLRVHYENSPAILSEIRSEPVFGDVPLVILTSARFATELAERELRATRGTWRMCGVSDPAQVVQALKAVLQLWAEGQRLPASSNSAT
jgi:CheY-like chemotaxis protein